MRRRQVVEPIFTLAAGSSVAEEVAFRGLLLHALITRARLPPLLAATLSSALFGVIHIWNERTAAHRAIYAIWTFFGGLLFSAAYLGTGGGLLSPILLHFGNNAVVFAVSVWKVRRAHWPAPIRSSPPLPWAALAHVRSCPRPYRWRLRCASSM